MSQFTRTTTVDSSPGADTTKAAVIDVDTDLTGIVAAYNAHDTATTNVHGSTGAATGTGAMVRATSPALVTPALGTPASGNLANCTGVPLNSQAIAENDVLVGVPTPFGSWVKKTIAEFKTILGLGTAAYTASTAYDAAGTAAGKIAASISDGDTTHAPDSNSVFDALALKQAKSGDGLAITAGKTITCTQDTALDEAVAMSSKVNQGAEKLKIWTYTHTLTSGEISATYCQVSISAVVFANLRLIRVMYNDPTNPGVRSAQLTDVYCASTTLVYVFLAASAAAGVNISITIIEAI